jgi:hypothetical protein
VRRRSASYRDHMHTLVRLLTLALVAVLDPMANGANGRLRTLQADEKRASPYGGRAVGFTEIAADAGLSPWQASIPDAEQVSPPVISVAAAMLGYHCILKSESAGRVCRDGLMAARKARGARRGDPRCQSTLFRRAPARAGRASMTKSPIRSSPSLRPAVCPGSSPGEQPLQRHRRRFQETLPQLVTIAASTSLFSGGP